jgi:hypothetical protein
LSKDNSEFIDVWSDDLIYLQEGRNAILTHPLRQVIPTPYDASSARLLAVVIVGGIEMMLDAWRHRDRLMILDRWFSKKRQNEPNEEKVQRLYDAFRQKKIEVDRKVFDDYLAIKYLRNTLIHSDWKNDQKKWVESRDFPGDTRKLTSEHWNRMLSINQSMMYYIALTGLLDPAALNKNPYSIAVEPIKVPEEVVTGIIRWQHIPEIYWNNIERITERIWCDVKGTTSTSEYAWFSGLSNEDLQKISWQEQKRLVLLSARRAGEDKHPALVQHRGLAREALNFWREYWRLTLGDDGITLEDIRESLETLRHLHEKALYPIGPFELPNEIASGISHQVIRSLLPTYEPLTEDEVLKSLTVGRTVHRRIRNVTAPSLLIELLPTVDPENTSAYLIEGEKALSAMELNNYWYSYVESRRSPEFDRWSFYRQISDEFLRRQKENLESMR